MATSDDAQICPETGLPWCYCDPPRSTVLKISGKDNANKGRQFFTCEVQRNAGGCDYFCWADEPLPTERKAQGSRKRTYRPSGLSRPSPYPNKARAYSSPQPRVHIAQPTTPMDRPTTAYNTAAPYKPVLRRTESVMLDAEDMQGPSEEESKGALTIAMNGINIMTQAINNNTRAIDRLVKALNKDAEKPYWPSSPEKADDEADCGKQTQPIASQVPNPFLEKPPIKMADFVNKQDIKKNQA